MNWGANAEKSQKQTLPFMYVDPHSVHRCLGPPHSPPKRQLDRYTHFRITMQQRPHWLQWDAQNYPQNCTFPFDDHQPHLIHPSLNWPHSTPQMASRSNQPFCHNTLCRQTDRPTNTQTVQANVPYHERSARYANREQRANNNATLFQKLNGMNVTNKQHLNSYHNYSEL